MKIQIIRSAPHRMLLESYTTKSGQRKNRYFVNPESKPVKTIKHLTN